MNQKRLFLILGLLLCVVVFQGCSESQEKELVAGDVFVDDFDSDVISDYWIIGPGETHRKDQYWSLTSNPGYLTIITQPADVHQTANNPINFFLREEPFENFQFIARIEIFPEEDFEQAGLLIWDDEDNYIRLARVHAYGEQAIEAAVEVAATYSTVIEDIEPLKAVYLKLVKLNDQISYYYSEDAKDWIEVGNRTWINYSNPQIGLYAISPVSERAIEAKFEYIRVEELKWIEID